MKIRWAILGVGAACAACAACCAPLLAPLLAGLGLGGGTAAGLGFGLPGMSWGVAVAGGLGVAALVVAAFHLRRRRRANVSCAVAARADGA